MTELSEWLIPAQQAALASYGYSHLPLALCSTTVKMFCHFQPNKNKPLVDRKQVGQHTGRSAPGNVCHSESTPCDNPERYSKHQRTRVH